MASEAQLDRLRFAWVFDAVTRPAAVPQETVRPARRCRTTQLCWVERKSEAGHLTGQMRMRYTVHEEGVPKEAFGWKASGRTVTLPANMMGCLSHGGCRNERSYSNNSNQDARRCWLHDSHCNIPPPLFVPLRCRHSPARRPFNRSMDVLLQPGTFRSVEFTAQYCARPASKCTPRRHRHR